MTAKKVIEIMTHSEMGELVRDCAKDIAGSKWYFVLSVVTLYVNDIYRVFSRLFEKYIFSDWTFFGYFSVAIMLDTLTGIVKSLNNRDFSSKALLFKLGKKFGMYAVILIIGNGFSKLVVGEEVLSIPLLGTEPLPVVTAILYLAIYYREGDSAIKNSSGKSIFGWVKYWFDSVKKIKSIKEEQYEQTKTD